MHGEGFFYQAFVYLAAAVVTVPLAKRIGLGSVLGYLIAGVMIGPFGLGFVGEEGQDVMHFAEFGVVMMLFLVGLELEPALLWRMRAPILGLGGAQVVATALLVAGIGLVLGLPWQQALAVGMVLALSSTAIVLQTLDEKGLTKTAAGQSSFAVLLFQDIAVIPMLALLPLLATLTIPGAGDGAGHGHTWVDGLPGWGQTLAVLGAVSAVVVCGRFVMRPCFRFIARTGLRELFVAAALLLIIGIALLMSKVGLSPALGTFVAGVVLANSEYRHELESDIAPFKGLLLGLFFIAVGASIDFALVTQQPGAIAGGVFGLMLVKLVVLLAIALIFRLGLDQSLLFSFALAQGGEFAFVLFSFAMGHGVLGSEITAPLTAVVALSMALTPLAMMINEKWVQPYLGTQREDAKPADAVDEANPVIIAGYGRYGQIVQRLLGAQGVGTTMLEFDSEQVELLRKYGRKVFYGDATRYDLLEAAGAREAKLLILALDSPEKTLQLVHTARKHFPQLTIVARAAGRMDAHKLLEAGVQEVFRETFESALRTGTRSLELLGYRAYRVHRAAQRFRARDEAMMRKLAGAHGEGNFINVARAASEELERLLREDLVGGEDARGDHGWDTESLREEFRQVGTQEPSP